MSLNSMLQLVYGRVTSGALIVLLDACREAMRPLTEELVLAPSHSPE